MLIRFVDSSLYGDRMVSKTGIKLQPDQDEHN
jgi:hypothetical protein